MFVLSAGPFLYPISAFARSFAPAGNSKCFRCPAALPVPAYGGKTGQAEAYAGVILR